jgi:hypothetical protein
MASLRDRARRFEKKYVQKLKIEKNQDFFILHRISGTKLQFITANLAMISDTFCDYGTSFVTTLRDSVRDYKSR